MSKRKGEYHPLRGDDKSEDKDSSQHSESSGEYHALPGDDDKVDKASSESQSSSDRFRAIFKSDFTKFQEISTQAVTALRTLQSAKKSGLGDESYLRSLNFI